MLTKSASTSEDEAKTPPQTTGQSHHLSSGIDKNAHQMQIQNAAALSSSFKAPAYFKYH